MGIRRRHLLAGLGLAVFTTGASALDAKTLQQLVKQEQQSLDKATRVYYPNRAMANRAAVSFHGQLLESHYDKGYLVMSLDDEQKRQLQSFGFRLQAAEQYRQQRHQQLESRLHKALAAKTASNDTIPGYQCYSTVEGTYAKAEALAQANPTLAKWVDIGDSWNKAADSGFSGFDINVLQITNQAIDKEKPVLFIHSAMHAREYATAELTLRFARKLLNGYGEDADISWILDNHQVHILFHMNPDGRKMAETGLMWRKNANSNYCRSQNSFQGADLNRNFTFSWKGTSNGSSGEECSEVFRGPYAASEPETQAVENYVRSLYPDRRGPSESDAAPLDTTGIHIDVHSFSELVLWPWGHTSAQAPNATELTTLGRKLAWFNGYEPIQGIGLYATDGTSDDVSYGELGVAAYTFELGTEFFQKCTVFENKIVTDNLPAFMYAAKVVGAPYILPKGPEAKSLQLNGLTRVNVESGAQVTLQATLQDDAFSERNGVEPSQSVIEAIYTINEAPWQEGATKIAMQFKDGAPDSASEVVEAQIDTEGLGNGKHMIYVQGKDADGNWGPVSAIYLLVGVPNANPVATLTSQCAGVKCQFDASASSDADGTIVNYRWQLGGTSIEGATQSVVEHTFTTEGEQEVALTVIDDLGGLHSIDTSVTVQNAPPQADFGLSCSNTSCTFNAAASKDIDGTLQEYAWTFGDGNSASGMSVNHNFASAGNYEVTLTVKDNFGATHAKAVTVTVTEPATQPPTNGGGSSGGGGALAWFAGVLALFGAWRRKV